MSTEIQLLNELKKMTNELTAKRLCKRHYEYLNRVYSAETPKAQAKIAMSLG